jgi:soluble lytic murein transglycosylase-like protein
VLGTIEALSGFQQNAVTPNGALGLMAINPRWSAKIGDGDVSKLMQMQGNMRFGCVLLRHFLDASSGDQSAALARYVESNFDLAAGNPQVAALVNRTRAIRESGAPRAA